MQETTQQNPYTIALYYKYVHIANPEQFRDEQKAFCDKHTLKGRIIVSGEGINGTFEGKTADVQAYVEMMRADARFVDIDYKLSAGTLDGTAFPRVSVKYRPEIVTLGTGTAEIKQGETLRTAPHLSPEEFQKMYDEKQDFVVVDMRNDYEQQVGHFENSLLMPIKSFKEIPTILQEVDKKYDLRNKKIVSVCTGGVRCEKATQYLMDQGFSDVSQLDGGMVRYLEKFPANKFKGSLYVFDNRVLTAYDSEDKEHEVIAQCIRCAEASERMSNCSNLDCHAHIICCEDCEQQDQGIFCSAQCCDVVKRNPEKRACDNTAVAPFTIVVA